MSTKGATLTPTTRQNISLSKTKYNKADLIKSGYIYLDRLQADPKQLPTISGLCLECGISREQLDHARINHPEVNALVNHIGQLQEEYALTRGMTNKANPVFAMFLLKSKHGFIDQPQQLNQTNNFNISPELLKDAIELMNSENKK